MNLLIQLLRFLTLLLLNLVFSLVAVLLRFLLLPLFIAVLLVLRSLISLSFTATVNNPRKFIDRLAGEWTLWLLDLDVDQNTSTRFTAFAGF